MPLQRGKIAVVGGANMDIGGFPSAALVPGDSNPGQVRMSVGGVGRNIAENAARMGLEVELITALGADANGRAIVEDCADKGIGMRSCRIEESERTSVYLFIDDAKGDMNCAVNDMQIQRLLTPEWIEPRLGLLNSMDAVCIDANLPEETIAYLASELRAPLFADAVSAAKVQRLRPALPKMHSFKPNRLEAELLTGMQINDMIDASEAARRLMDAGVKRVYLSMDAMGALCAEGMQCAFLPGVERNLVNATGAGDAFSAALLWAHVQGMSLQESGIAGMAAASIAVESIETVNPDMNEKILQERMAAIAARCNLRR